MLWFMEIVWILLVLLTVGGLLIGIDLLIAIALILFFGTCAIGTGYTIGNQRYLARQQKGFLPTMAPKRSLLTIIGKSLAWGFAAGGLVFAAFFFGPMIFNPESNLAPIGGFLFGPVAFVVGTFVAGLCQIRRVPTLPKGGKVG